MRSGGSEMKPFGCSVPQGLVLTCLEWALCSPMAAAELSWADSGDSGLAPRDFSASGWNVKVWLSFWEQPWLSLPPGVTVIKVIKNERYEVTKAIEAVKNMLPNPNPWRLKLRLPQVYKLVEIFIVCEKTKLYTSVCEQLYFSRSGNCIKQDMDYHKKSVSSCALSLLHFISCTCWLLQCVTTDFGGPCSCVVLWLRNVLWSWCCSGLILELLQNLSGCSCYLHMRDYRGS